MNDSILNKNNFHFFHQHLFHPLPALTDIHMEGNVRLEMYCDYDWSNHTLFPNLRSMYVLYFVINMCLNLFNLVCKIYARSSTCLHSTMVEEIAAKTIKS